MPIKSIFIACFLLCTHLWIVGGDDVYLMNSCRCSNSSVDTAYGSIGIDLQIDAAIAQYLHLPLSEYKRTKHAVYRYDANITARFRDSKSYLIFTYGPSSGCLKTYANDIDSTSLQYIEIGVLNNNVNQQHFKTIKDTINIRNWKSSLAIYLGMPISEFVAHTQSIVFSSFRTFREYKIFDLVCDSVNGQRYTSETIVRTPQDFISDNIEGINNFRVRVSAANVVYRARYIFRNDSLVKFGFGYTWNHPSQDFENVLY